MESSLLRLSFVWRDPSLLEARGGRQSRQAIGSSRCRSRAARAARSCRSCPAPMPRPPNRRVFRASSRRRSIRGPTASVDAAGTQHQCGIAHEAGAFGSCQGRSLEPGFPLVGTHRQPFDQVGIGPFRRAVEVWFTTGRGLAVPGAYVLADIAPEDPAIERGGLVVGEHAAVLDRPVADAPARVELIRADEGLSRAGLEAARAGSAVVDLMRGVIGQLGVDQSAPRNVKLPRRRLMSIVFLPIQPIPASRAKSRSSNGAVSTTARPRIPGAFDAKPRQQGLQLVPQDPMVITPSRVSRDLSMGRRAVARCWDLAGRKRC